MRRVMPFTIAILLGGVLAVPSVSAAQQSQVHHRLPSRLDAEERYVIYLHGRIIEDEGRRPTHPAWGVYEYDEILEALADGGTVVVSEHRSPGTDMDRFAAHVRDQVQTLMAAGVPPHRISVVGFSKGGGIAIRASALLRTPRLNFVFLGACGSGDFSKVDVSVLGRILSVFEESDEVGRSCAELFEKPGFVGESAEVKIDTGGEHGAFYRPRSEWLSPVLRWIRGG